MTSNEMNQFIRGAVGLPVSPGGQNQPTHGLTPEQVLRIEKYLEIEGVTYQEARDLVLSFVPPDPPPLGNAGAGMESAGLPGSGTDMNRQIRIMTGHQIGHPLGKG